MGQIQPSSGREDPRIKCLYREIESELQIIVDRINKRLLSLHEEVGATSFRLVAVYRAIGPGPDDISKHLEVKSVGIPESNGRLPEGDLIEFANRAIGAENECLRKWEVRYRSRYNLSMAPLLRVENGALVYPIGIQDIFIYVKSSGFSQEEIQDIENQISSAEAQHVTKA